MWIASTLSMSPPTACGSSFSNITPTPVGELLPSTRPLAIFTCALRHTDIESSVHDLAGSLKQWNLSNDAPSLWLNWTHCPRGYGPSVLSTTISVKRACGVSCSSMPVEPPRSRARFIDTSLDATPLD